ncbi:hypothetical protein [Shumkonia mesophila]|uniref:hypothetical protein n=1 Tax=Shumkonia mesophila TaxID=2838854 RepID=UPI002934CD59|nr:hypothetical protein [Shumkonia mesophila]
MVGKKLALAIILGSAFLAPPSWAEGAPRFITVEEQPALYEAVVNRLQTLGISKSSIKSAIFRTDGGTWPRVRGWVSLQDRPGGLLFWLLPDGTVREAYSLGPLTVSSPDVKHAW